MKPAPFDYQAPATPPEAVRLLASNPDATVIAGGQSLMPILAFQWGTPSLLVDLRLLPGLGDIGIGDARVRLGALVRWRDIENDRRLAMAHPLLREAVAHVAHYQIRNRGTIGGSLAHADPAAELPGVAVTCEAAITLVGPAGSRTVPAGEFFTGPLSTVRKPDEIITVLHLAAGSALGLSGICPAGGRFRPRRHSAVLRPRSRRTGWQCPCRCDRRMRSTAAAEAGGSAVEWAGMSMTA